MPQQDDLKKSQDDKKKLIQTHEHRLQLLKQRQATEGISVDPKVAIEIEEIEAKIKKLETELEAADLQILVVDDESNKIRFKQFC